MARNSSFLMQQKIALGVVIFVIVVAIGYFSTDVLKDTPVLGDFEEGEHYIVLENPRRVRGEKIEVMEFFSYACPHCYNFEPELADWAEDNQARINFVQTPAVSSDYWRLLGRNYYTLESLELLDDQHMAFFREIHDVKRQFTSPDALADYYDGKGVTRADYLDAFNSTEVVNNVSMADRMGRRLLVSSVPSVVVHGKYMVRTTRSVGPSRMLDVLNFLVDKVEQERISAEG